MSGIVALFDLKQAPISASVVQRLSEALAHRGPDGSGLWISGSVGLAHRMLWTTPESVHEQQPFVDGAGYAIVFDGRIDNRPDLFKAVRCIATHSAATSDAELVLSLYRVFGKLCPLYILGDFSFAIWDPTAQQLFCARDALGVKPLYYHGNSSFFVAASEIRPILAHPHVSLDINDGMVAEYLAASINNAEETLYANIRRLPPAHRLIAGRHGVKIERYFEVDPAREIRYAKEEDYAEHFSELLNAAVQCRLRSISPTAISLSGGLDSSTIAAVASRLSGSGAVNCPDLLALSMTFPGVDECDESRYIKDVAGKTGLQSILVPAAEHPRTAMKDHVFNVLDFPEYPNGAMANPLRKIAKEKGVRVILTGLGGDEWLMGSYCHYADLLARFRLGELGKHFRERTSLAGSRFSWRTAIRYGLWPLLPQFIQSSFDGILQRNHVPRWISARFARRTNLLDRIKEPACPRFPTFAQQDIYRVLSSGWRIHALEMEDRCSASHGVEQWHPLSDRRILEFALAIPEDQRWSQSQTKFVLRNACKEILPESVRLRNTKAEFSSVFFKAFESHGGRHLFRDLSISSLGWIQETEVLRKYRDMEEHYRLGNTGYAKHTCPLWMVAGINFWYEAISWRAKSVA
jgi:asparagine synthase (glutamine-hydrolysing)